MFRYIGLACAVLAILSSVLYYVLKFKELRLLREIRDRLDKP